MVIVLDKRKKPMGFTTPKRARKLLEKKRAVVHKMYPFTIRVKDVDSRNFNKEEHTLKIDPGSKNTGIAVVDSKDNVVLLAEIEHRAQKIVSLLKTRHDARRNRRQRETRYRRCKFINRYLKKGSKYKADSNRPKGWLPPSIQSITDNIVSWTKKLKKLCNITKIEIEGVRFDTQLMDDPNIQGVEYQQGTLFGYELREYLLQKYGNQCQYCVTKDEETKKTDNASKDDILQIEHKNSKNNGGSNKVSNLIIACKTCNQEKGSLNLEDWLALLKKSRNTKLNQIRIENITKILEGKVTTKLSNRYCAWVNSSKNATFFGLKELCNNTKSYTGGRTKFNRTNLNLPKEHYYDALSVGNVPLEYKFKTPKVLKIKAYGRGSRFRGRTNDCGIIISKLPRQKNFYGFQTGDIVKAVVPKGKKVGTHIGRVAVRSSGYFNITTKDTVVQGISHKHCKVIQRSDGYSYILENRNTMPKLEVSSHD